MLTSFHVTNDTLDITRLWQAATGEDNVRALAHMRGGSVTSVSVQDDETCIMCRSAVAAILTPDIVAAIEEGHDVDDLSVAKAEALALLPDDSITVEATSAASR